MISLVVVTKTKSPRSPMIVFDRLFRLNDRERGPGASLTYLIV